MNPIKSIASRYATKTISPNFYSTINVSGSTLIGTKGSGTTSGYIYVPYVIVNNIEEYKREKLRAERKEKLKKIYGLKCN